MDCNRCGSKIESDDRVCNFCRGELEKENEKREIIVIDKLSGNIVENIDKPSISQTMLIFLIEVILLFLVLIASAYIPKNFLKLYFALAELPLLVPIIIIIKIYGFKAKKLLRLNKTSISNCAIVFAIGFLAVFMAMFINLIYMSAYKGIFGSADVPDLKVKNSYMLIFFIFSVAVTPSIFEELIFRGFIQRGFEKYGYIKAVIITGALFGLIHFNFVQIPALIFLGIIAGLVTYITNSVYMGMLVHFINNAYAVLMVYLAKNINVGNKKVDMPNISISIIGFALFVLFLLGIFVVALFVALHFSNKSYVNNKLEKIKATQL